MTISMNGKNCIVTGGSGGIGKAIAARLIADGAKVAILVRDTVHLDVAASRLGAIALPCDLSNLEDVRHASATLAVNHLAPYLLTRLLVPQLFPVSRVIMLGPLQSCSPVLRLIWTTCNRNGFYLLPLARCAARTWT